jgi:two-component system sensor histidine kinase AgrC
MFDLIRILGIAMDNAIEASTELGSKSRIDIMVFKNQSNGIEFEIKNLVKNENIRINEIQRSGVTSKVDHLGVGLANVKEIISKYSNMSLDLKIENKYFTFYLVVDEEEPL